MERTFGEITWIDLIRPTRKNLDDLRRKFRLHEVIVKELEEPSARSKVEVYGDYLYLIYYFPVFDPKEQTSARNEIDFIVTKDTVVTVHYEDVEPLKSVKEGFPTFASSFDLTYRILSSLLNYQDRQLRHIREKVESVGPMLFKNKERDVMRTISRLKRDISEYRIISRHQSPIIHSLISNAKFFGNEEANRPYMDALLGDHIKILDLVEDYRNAVTDYEDTNNQLLNLQINDTMKTFAIMSFMTFPFVLFVALVDMNVIDNPFREMNSAFWIVLGLVVAGMIVLYNYFKNRRLL